MANKLFYGDNLQVLKDSIDDESIDLIYLDPPFNSKANYNILFRSPSGKRSTAQIEAFEDTWHWNEHAALAFDEVMRCGNQNVANILRAMFSFLGENDMMAYLSMMAIRLVHLHRVLKPTGSLYLHCDPTASAYLKVLMDAVFGGDRYLNEIIWRRTGSHNPRRSLGPVHDVIHAYTKSSAYKFNVIRRPYMKGHVESRYTQMPDGRMKFTSGGNVLTGAGPTEDGASGKPWRGFDPTAKNRHWAIPGAYEEFMSDEYQNLNAIEKLEALYQAGLVEIVEGNAWPIMVRYLDERDGTPLTDLWTFQPYTQGTAWGDPTHGIDEDVKWLGPTDPERLGYPTQKPVGLIERILRTGSKEGDVVLDPFCGCGTTIHASQKLDRQWIGIDITHLAISLIERRLKDSFPTVTFEVEGTPKDLEGARDLAKRDPYQFQWWAISLINAIPAGGKKKKGADRGIDGYLNFRDADGKPQIGIVSVKGGDNVGVTMIRDLKGVVGRDKACVGVFLSLVDPTRDMKKEAASAGFYETGGMKFPKIQILTVEELFDGRTVHIPFGFTEGFKKAARETKEKQGSLL
ncbi:MAG: site-specific DNA-methyltransferase [Calditrichaeota bacterium]|nr:site-specific DNA-methyltransferase [Calditrichota bacterium]